MTEGETQQPGAEAVRVVLVGKTALHGVDEQLRTDRGLELVRARTPLAALGELANPIDDETGDRVTVVVAPDALAAERSAAFSSAVKRIAPEARLLTMGEQVPEGFHDRLMMNDAARPLVVQVRERGETSFAATAPAAVDVKMGAPSVPAEVPPAPAAPAAGELETSPVMALATGRDVVAAALAGIQKRLNVAGVEFRDPSAKAVGGEHSLSVPVVFNKKTLGSLVVTGAQGQPAPNLEMIQREAEQLGVWLTVSVQQEQLRHAAFTDELTGAWNRRYFNRFLNAAIADAASSRHSVTLLVFDVDNFKTFNDRFGHAAGDEILVHVVRLLNACIRSTDRVCRIGGDEFAVIFHDPEGPRGPAGAPTSPRSITDIVRRFQKQVCEHRFPKLGELAPGTLTVSGGMATFPWDGRTVQQLLDRADDLARHSKGQGKNHITLGPGAEQVCRVD